MRKLHSVLLVLGLTCGFWGARAEAGVIVAQSQLRPVNAAIQPFYVAYTVTLERVLPYPYTSPYQLTFYPYLVCQTACPRMPLPQPSRLAVTRTYYDACNGFVYEAVTNLASEIKAAGVADNLAWGCPIPPAGPVTAWIIRYNGASEYLVGTRTP
ncbi:MAG: hypothetical protein HYW49_12840 [Deltaproteobacteria bacterium]|nr:hypothetical protein [Deltaproteobacteria bacterium]